MIMINDIDNSLCNFSKSIDLFVLLVYLSTADIIVASAKFLGRKIGQKKGGGNKFNL